MINKLKKFYWLGISVGAALLIGFSGCAHFQDKNKSEEQTSELSTQQLNATTESSLPTPAEVSPTVSETNLWKEIVQGYGLPQVDDDVVNKNLRWYGNNQAYLDRALNQSKLYLYHVAKEIRENELPTELTLLPIVESSYNPFAVSPSKAVGIWQFVPRTGRSFGLAQNHWYDGRRDPLASTKAAIAYFKYLHNMFDGDWLVAIAAYNAGEGTVARAIKKNKRMGKPIDYWSLPLPKETQAYVPQLLALAKIVADPAKYELQLTEISNLPFFALVNVKTPVDLNKVAKIAEIDPAILRNLNAGYNRWITTPTGPHQLLVPIDSAEQFSLILEKMPQETPIKILADYKIKSGDTLGAIAKRYGTDVSSIQKMNGLKNTRLKLGQILTIPGLVQVDSPYSSSAQDSETFATENNAQSTRLYYTVKSGDSLWTISRKYNTTVDKLRRLNNLSSRSKLQPKQKLLVTSNNVMKREGNKITYQIEHGDTIHRIASKFDVSKKDILSWNTVKDESYIHPGQEITIYVNNKN